MVMVTAFGVALATRAAFEVDVLRERGALYSDTADGRISNSYSLRVLNKTQDPQRYRLEVRSDLPIEVARSRALESELRALPGERLDLPLTLGAAREAVSLPSTPVTIELCELSSGRCAQAETRFLGPIR
jgi:polyferredoxin